MGHDSADATAAAGDIHMTAACTIAGEKWEEGGEFIGGRMGKGKHEHVGSEHSVTFFINSL